MIECGYCKEEFEDQQQLAKHCYDDFHLISSILFRHLCPVCGQVDNILSHHLLQHPTFCFYCFRELEDPTGIHEECAQFCDVEWVDKKTVDLILYCGHCHNGPFFDRESLAIHCERHYSLDPKQPCPECGPVDDFFQHLTSEHGDFCSWCFNLNYFPITNTFQVSSKHKECRIAWIELTEPDIYC